jgi:flavin reductase (DIM6/NTAB) family NADH-FMN oxidoreductase RutF
MIIDVASADPQQVYKALVGVVNPRPIAWVTSIDERGLVNLAPFSFFNVFGSNPALVVFSPTFKRDGTKKDTLLNVEAVPEFVINVAVSDLAEPMNLTAKELPHGESEAALAGLTLTPSARVRPPRVAESPAHLECRVKQILSFGTGPGAANLVIGEVLLIEIADRMLDGNGTVDPHQLQTIGRLGGNF